MAKVKPATVLKELARMIGHRDLNSLLIYYRKSAADMATQLD